LDDGSPPVRLGNLDSAGSGQPLEGFIEDFELRIGTALYTSNFTPPGKLSTADQEIELFQNMPKDIQVGDKGYAYRGCHKRSLEDCRDIFDNIVNFRGEPYLPGKGKVFVYPDATAG
jgi:hypothetical protein